MVLYYHHIFDLYIYLKYYSIAQCKTIIIKYEIFDVSSLFSIKKIRHVWLCFVRWCWYYFWH